MKGRVSCWNREGKREENRTVADDLSSLLCEVCVCTGVCISQKCICKYMCIRQECVCVCVSQKLTDRRYLSQLLSILFLSQIISWKPQITPEQTIWPRDPPISAPRHGPQSWDHTRHYTQPFTWALMIRTQVLYFTN